MSNGRYILRGHLAIPCRDLLTLAIALSKSDRIVAKTKLENVSVSTVFLGVDHSFGDGPPLLFETMVFGGALDREQERYSTWEEAEARHARMVAQVKGGAA